MESLDKTSREISQLRTQPVVGKGQPFKRLVYRGVNFLFSRIMNIFSLFEETMRAQQKQISDLAARIEKLQQVQPAPGHLDAALPHSADPVEDPNWRDNLPAEIEFWRGIISDRGVTAGCAEEIEQRLNPDTPLQGYLRDLLPAGGPVRILDIGAGPFTMVGKKWDNRQVDIVAVDALAKVYDELLAEYGVVPPVRTIECAGERVAEKFPEQSFDLVYILNALDHCFDPVKVLQSAVTVLRTNGYIFLSHHANEGEHQNYFGLHQWNLTAMGDHFIIWNPNSVHWVNNLLRGVQIRCKLMPIAEGGHWLHVFIHKQR